ncbi:MAG TPA: DUF4382 domain-containing protein [Gemmatimonadaceae bacterium]|nr:DUF4382 domain-containing protein [Gemmatimonadaceae bacterium]
MKNTLRILSVLAGAGLGATACGESGGLPLLTGTAQLTVQLTDKPFPFSEVKRVDIFVERVDAKPAETPASEAEDPSATSGWTTLVTPNTLINLLDLTNGKTANLGVATLPAGTYRSFRMVIDTDKSSITLNNDTKPDVKWPAAGINGIKIILDEPVVVASPSNLLIDFDVGRSFVLRGNSISQNGLIFKRVLRGTSQQSTGSVAGSVRAETAAGAGVAGATVEVLKNGTALTDTNDNNVVRTGMTDGSGNFTLAFLPPGTYVVRATPPDASGYKPALLTDGLTVTAGTAVTGKTIVVTK